MEALANVNQFGVCGMDERELMKVNGGDADTWFCTAFAATMTALSGGNPYVGLASYALADQLCDSVPDSNSSEGSSNVDADDFSDSFGRSL